jgi:hypothetical protein
MEDNGVIVPATTSPPAAIERINSLRVSSFGMTIHLLRKNHGHRIEVGIEVDSELDQDGLSDILSQEPAAITHKRFPCIAEILSNGDVQKSRFPHLILKIMNPHGLLGSFE